MIELILTSSVLILVITLLRFCLRGHISARLQYALWGFVALRLLLPFSLFETPVSVMNLLETGSIVVSNGVADAATPFTTDFASVTPVEADSNNLDFVSLALVIWLCGTTLCSLVFVFSNLRISKKLQKNRLRIELPGCKLPVYIVYGLPSPCLYGLWKPSIYLTSESMEDSSRLNHILAHEETHYRQKDYLWVLLRAICLCLHWYNPLVWLAAAFSKKDSELACDESTLKRLGDENRIAYGKTLVEMITVPVNPSSFFSCTTTMHGSKDELAERLRRIVKKPKILTTVVITTLLITVTTVVATFGSAVNTVEDESSIYKEPHQLAEWLKSPFTMEPNFNFNGTSKSTKPQKASYHFTCFDKGDEVISIDSLTDEKLAENIILDSMLKSAAWPGVDISTLEKYYFIEQTFSTEGETETHDYYAYLKDGKAVLQSGAHGMYTFLSMELYDELDNIYQNAIEHSTDLSVKNTPQQKQNWITRASNDKYNNFLAVLTSSIEQK